MKREVQLNTVHDYVTLSDTVADVRTPGVVVEAPDNVGLTMGRIFTPVIKLFDNAGDQIPGNTQVFMGKKVAGSATETLAPGVFTLESFYDLTTAQQRNAENKAALAQDLGMGIRLREGEQMIFYFLGSAAIDWTQAGTAFEFPMTWVSY